METLEELRNEYSRLGIGPLLHELLEKIVWSTASQYPASEYSPSGSWNRMAFEDILNDWVAERLWGRSDLQAMLASVTSYGKLRASLTTSLRQHLTNKRRRSIVANLYKRVRVLMRDDPAFQPLGPESLGAEQRWTLSDAPTQQSSILTLRELLRIASALSDDDLAVVRYGPFSQKLSPILREPKLRDFLRHLLGHAQGSMTVGSILDVMRLRFSLPIEEESPLDDSIPTLSPDPADEAANKTRALSVVSRLMTEEARILEAYFRTGGNFVDTAASCRVSLEQARTFVCRALKMVCDCSDSLEDARAIMQAIESLLLRPGA
jgi:hypothetical protein